MPFLDIKKHQSIIIAFFLLSLLVAGIFYKWSISNGENLRGGADSSLNSIIGYGMIAVVLLVCISGVLFLFFCIPRSKDCYDVGIENAGYTSDPGSYLLGQDSYKKTKNGETIKLTINTISYHWGPLFVITIKNPTSINFKTNRIVWFRSKDLEEKIGAKAYALVKKRNVFWYILVDSNVQVWMLGAVGILDRHPAETVTRSIGDLETFVFALREHLTKQNQKVYREKVSSSLQNQKIEFTEEDRVDARD